MNKIEIDNAAFFLVELNESILCAKANCVCNVTTSVINNRYLRVVYKVGRFVQNEKGGGAFFKASYLSKR